MKKSGFDRVRARLNGLGEKVNWTFAEAHRESGEEIVALAKVLVPEGGTGDARRLIKGQPWEGTSYMIDFGPLSKILDGGTEERSANAGESRGRGRARPFDNPAIQATKKKRQARYRRAVKGLLKDD